jgi:hypothetical protein
MLKKPNAAMTRVAFTAVLFVAGAVSWAAGAENLREIQAMSLQLGDVSGVAYYTVQGQGTSRDACRPRQRARAVREHAVA